MGLATASINKFRATSKPGGSSGATESAGGMVTASGDQAGRELARITLRCQPGIITTATAAASAGPDPEIPSRNMHTSTATIAGPPARLPTSAETKRTGTEHG